MAAVPEKNPPEAAPAEVVDHRFHVAVWTRVRPYAECFTADFLISVMLYLLQWVFKLVASWAPIGGWAGTFMVHLHSTGAVLVFALFIGLLLSDVIEIHRGRQ